MSYQPHNLLAFGGTLTTVATDDEIWECTIRGGYSGGGGFAPLTGNDCDDYLAALHAPLATWWAAANTKIPTNVKLNYIKFNPIDANGHYSDPNPHTYVYSGSVAGGNAVTATPSFLSLCYSWRTDKTVGMATKGRMYLPNVANLVTTGTASVTSGLQTTAATQAAALIALMRITVPSGAKFKPHVVSRSGAINEITSVLVGNVIDVQRRRKKKVRETYVADVFGPG